MCEQITYEELNKLYIKARLDATDAEYEREMYREKNRSLRSENASQKQHIEFSKRENDKTFRELLAVIFPNYWRTQSMPFKNHFPSVIKDMEDEMLGLVVDGFGTNKIKCYMQNEKYRNLDTYKKQWVTIY